MEPFQPGDRAVLTITSMMPNPCSFREGWPVEVLRHRDLLVDVLINPPDRPGFSLTVPQWILRAA